MQYTRSAAAYVGQGNRRVARVEQDLVGKSTVSRTFVRAQYLIDSIQYNASIVSGAQCSAPASSGGIQRVIPLQVKYTTPKPYLRKASQRAVHRAHRGIILLLCFERCGVYPYPFVHWLWTASSQMFTCAVMALAAATRR